LGKVVTEHPPLRQLLTAVQEQMKSDFATKSAVLPHAGEKGIAREDILRSFLEDYLPARFGVSSGFVFDARGQASGQMDIVIYDKASCPVLKVSSTRRMFPVESVASVISVKSHLSASELADATSNLRSVLHLDRFASGRPYAMHGGVMHELWPDAPMFSEFSAEPLLAIVFAFDSPGIETVAMRFRDLNRDVDSHLRIQLLTILNRGTISWLDDGLFEPTVSPTAIPGFCDDPDFALPAFYSFVANGSLRRSPLAIRFNAYLSLGGVVVTPVE
jgi:hypothetical protein